MKSAHIQGNMKDNDQGKGRVGLRGRSPFRRDDKAPVQNVQRMPTRHNSTAQRSLSARPSAGKPRPGSGDTGRLVSPAARKFARSNASSPCSNPLDKYRISMLRFIQSFQAYKQMKKCLKTDFTGLMSARQGMIEENLPINEGVIELEKSLETIVPDINSQEVLQVVSLEDLKKEVEDIKAWYKVIIEEKRDVEESLHSLGLQSTSGDKELVQEKAENKEERDPSLLSINLEDNWTEHIVQVKHILNKLKVDIHAIKNSVDAVLASEPIKENQEETENCTAEKKEMHNEEASEDVKQVEPSADVEALMTQRKLNDELLAENIKLEGRVAHLERKLRTREETVELTMKELKTKLQELKSLREQGTDVGLDSEPNLYKQVSSYLSIFSDIRDENGSLGALVGDSLQKIHTLEEVIKNQHNQLEQQEQILESIQEALSEDTGSESACKELKEEIKELQENITKQKAKMNCLYSKYKPLKTENRTLKRQVQTIEKKSWIRRIMSF